MTTSPLLLGYALALAAAVGLGSLMALKSRDELPDWLAGAAIMLALIIASLV